MGMQQMKEVKEIKEIKEMKDYDRSPGNSCFWNEKKSFLASTQSNADNLKTVEQGPIRILSI